MAKPKNYIWPGYVPEREVIVSRRTKREPPIEYDTADIVKDKPKLEYEKHDLGMAYQKEAKQARKALGVKVPRPAGRIAGISAAKRYLATKPTQAVSGVSRLRKAVGAVGKAAKGLGKGIPGIAASIAAEELGAKFKVPKAISTGVSYGVMASRAAMPAMGIAAGVAEGASSFFGKHIGELREETKAKEAGAREYTKAKSWADTRKIAFRRGIQAPGGKKMTLEEAADIAKRVRKGR